MATSLNCGMCSGSIESWAENWSATWNYNQGWEWWHQVHIYLQSRMNCSFLCLVVCLEWEQQLTLHLNELIDWLVRFLGRLESSQMYLWSLRLLHTPEPKTCLPFICPWVCMATSQIMVHRPSCQASLKSVISTLEVKDVKGRPQKSF